MLYPRLDLSFYTLDELEALAAAALTEDRTAVRAVIDAHETSDRVVEARRRFRAVGDRPLFYDRAGNA